MFRTKAAKATIAALFAAALAASLCACQSSDGATAATVNGTTITEKQVTDQIKLTRTRAGANTDNTWGSYLSENEMTPSSVRENAVTALVNQELIRQYAANHDLTITDEDIDTYVNLTKSEYKDADAWLDALKQSALDSGTYRTLVNIGIIQDAVIDGYIEDADPEDEEYDGTIASYSSYFDGAKRTSHILFDSTDEELAKSVRGQIADGSLSFADAVVKYSTDKNSANRGGDVGWNLLNTYPQEYSSAVAKLDQGAISEPVATEYGFHIIMVTDVFDTPDDGIDAENISVIPEDFLPTLKKFAAASQASTKFSSWLQELTDMADITVYSMPENAEYNVDMSKYAKDDDEDEDTDSTSSDDGITETSSDDATADYTIDASDADASGITEVSTEGSTTGSSGITEITTDESGTVSSDDVSSAVASSATDDGISSSASSTASSTE